LLFCREGTVWNGSIWSNGFPTTDKSAVFNANYDIAADTKFCSCVVNSGVTVTVKNEASLELVSNYSGAGNLVFENNSSLYQLDDSVKNAGIIQFKRKTTPVRKMDYTYWASPVAAQQLKTLSPDSPLDNFYSFDSNVNYWHKESPTSKMILGKGYIFQAPKSFSDKDPAIFEAVFSGIPNNGLVTVPISKTKSANLIGNPYPSALNADVFVLENQNFISGSLYFWTHNTPISNGQYTSDDYAVYNILGGVGVAANNLGVNTSKPNGKIATGQSFFVLGSNPQGGNAIFKNAMRLKGENNLFFKNTKTDKSTADSNFEKHRIWLNLSNNKGVFKQILVGYATGATNGKDILFDGVSLDANQWLDFYSLNEGEKNTIQGRALPFDVSDAVVMGYRSKQEGSFTISLDDFDGLFANQNIFLEDLQESKIQDLKKGDYSFSTIKGTFDNRFVLRFQNKNLVPEEVSAEVQILTQNNHIQISSFKDKINKVSIYSLEGKKLYQAQLLETKTHSVEASLWKTNVLIVQITLETGEVVSRKVLF
jgi:hypothetical protein